MDMEKYRDMDKDMGMDNGHKHGHGTQNIEQRTRTFFMNTFT
jgi:hypothetical protein